METDPREEYAEWKAPETLEAAEPSIAESEKVKFLALAESVGSLAAGLKQRESLRLNALTEESGSNRLSSASLEIQGLTENSKTKLEEYQATVSKLAEALKTFGKAPVERMVHEDTDNLRRINFLIAQLGENTRALRGSLGAKEQKSLEPIIKQLQGVNETLEKIWQWIAKKASLLEGRH